MVRGNKVQNFWEIGLYGCKIKKIEDVEEKMCHLKVLKVMFHDSQNNEI